VSRELSRAVSVGVDADYWKEDYKDSGFETNETNVATWIGWSVSRTVDLRVMWNYWQRGVNGPQQDSSENRYWLTVEWTPNKGRASRIQGGPRTGLEPPTP
jgi:hypothetical protein